MKSDLSSKAKLAMHQKPIFHYVVIASVILTLISSAFTLYNVHQLKKAVIPRTININDFQKKLMTHEEMKAYVGVAPLNIVQVTSGNLLNLQSQISGLNISHIGDFLVQYTNMIVIYDYDRDVIKGSINLQQPIQLPADFFTKLNKHTEMKGLQNEQPIGGKLDESSLNALKQQFPDVYAKAKVGDYVLRYQTKLVIYDFTKDKIVNVVNLS